MINLQQNLRLEQRLTPQQILLSTLLQLPLLSLEQKIKSELETNPVLEEGDENENEIEATAEETEEVEQELDQFENSNQENDEYDKEELDQAQKDNDLEDFLNDQESYEIRIPKDKNKEEYDKPEVFVKTLPEHLMEQLHILNLSEKQFAIGEYLIWNIHDNGYMDEEVDLKNVAINFETTVPKVENVLKKIQLLDPTGVGARTLQECLIVQLREREYSDPVALAILSDHFDDFKNKRYAKIIELLDITPKRFEQALEQIKKLNPKPGEGLFDSRSNYIVPDFIVEKMDDDFVVTLNEWNIPPLRISPTYKKMLMNKNNTDKETRQYVRKKVESARWFITSIYQRRMTMLKVMHAIIDKQRPFFEKGPEYIKPLIMREIAELIEMDISTVSRVCNGKYVQTDYGVFELKYFFNERIENEAGEEISTRKIKARIKELVEAEDPKKPLSDEKLSKVLKEEGFPIARRTVAKYREQLQIPVARLRRGL
ncbi:MAG: RNA polymerase factor sigma-54 [Caldithrix sp.]|nr:RNA polymerase factor sigma-54 [Caldithrix sp.]